MPAADQESISPAFLNKAQNPNKSKISAKILFTKLRQTDLLEEVIGYFYVKHSDQKKKLNLPVKHTRKMLVKLTSNLVVLFCNKMIGINDI